MGTVILLITLTFLLIWWHIELNLLAAVSLRVARRYLDWSVPRKATRLVRLAKTYVGFTLEVDRDMLSEIRPPFILVANHQSLADIVIILAAFRDLPIRFVAKAELRSGFPGVSAVLKHQQHALIDRKANFRTAIATLRRLGRRAREGLCPVVFPEGTRSRTGAVGKFYAGAVKAIHAQCPMPVVCVALEGGRQFVEYRHIISGVSGAVYKARVLDVQAVPTTQLSILLDDYRKQIAAQLERWHSHEARAH